MIFKYIFNLNKWAAWIFFYFFYLGAEPLQLEIAGASAILMNAATGAILFEKEADTPHYPASTTKIATALYILEQLKTEGDWNKLVLVEADPLLSVTEQAKVKSNYTVPPHYLEPGGTQIGLKCGEEICLRDLLAGMLISSGNDAANVLAREVGGTVPHFMEELNLYLKRIGCRKTCFLNPHGLHHPTHQTTAFDLALMTRMALRFPLFCEIVCQTKFMRPKTSKQPAAVRLQTNRLLRPGTFYYSKAIGVKTGYHRRAKKTLVAAARKEERTLIAVLLKYEDSKEIFKDAARLFEAAFNQPKVRKIYLKAGKTIRKIELPHADRSLDLLAEEQLSLDYYPAEDPQGKCWIYLNPHLTLPVLKGAKVGEARLISAQDSVLATIPLVAAETVACTWPFSWLHRLKSNAAAFPYLTATALLLFCFLVLLGGMWLAGVWD